ncbi:hypothetical protein SedNR2807_02010 [Citrobacter sedlakii]
MDKREGEKGDTDKRRDDESQTSENELQHNPDSLSGRTAWNRESVLLTNLIPSRLQRRNKALLPGGATPARSSGA